MRLVGYLNAVVALREVIEEYAPENGVTQVDMINLIKEAYSFQTAPPPASPIPTMAFGTGRYTDGDVTFAIGMLIMEANGDVVQTVTTDQADLVLKDLMFRLDRDLGFRFATASKRKSYLSNVVVEFDVALESHIDAITRMGTAINRAIPEKPHFGLKRLAFGAGTKTAPTSQVENVEMSDFLIERRADAPIEQNRYYCSAPMRTQDHLLLLAELEAIAMGRAT